ncbi:M14 family metallopeptidase [Pseudohongiella spirulinae]|uniref:Peptidase M14, carboxypeptidase A n=1 Tax=Pseudohongiella spirulinae TaxID=1249552 RepID=A0A0S2KDJ1_9GAMM|nr:M14 family metallopeptidase [Pseudohongiella spirulinae]ALO46385.1 Peptidase M14, carboxypeptidase A [Pseudohongiella spirulinae]
MRTSYKGLLFVALLLLAACHDQPSGNISTDVCRFDTVHFVRDFAGARLNHCEQLDEHHYQLRIDPAFTPVNPSAWYAFQVISDTKQSLQITLSASAGFARYAPKASRDGVNWHTLEFEADEADMQFNLQTDGNTLYVAGQPLIVDAHYARWLNRHATQPDIQLLELGVSEQGRAIQALQSLATEQSDDKSWLLLIGRQHPPEVTGAMAFFTFSDQVLSDTSLAQQFRAEYNLLIIPNVNPDGVAAGNWRHNSRGMDLNRDWHALSQAETRAVAAALAERVQSPEELVFALDFHSTNRNVYYTMPDNKDRHNPQLTNDWLTETDRRLPDYNLEAVPGDNPGGGVFKQFIADVYQTHAVTYEVGDNTDPDEIELTAKTAATVLMEQLLW